MKNITLILLASFILSCTSSQQISGNYTKETNSVVNATDYDKVETPRKERIERHRRKLYHKTASDADKVNHEQQDSKKQKSKSKYLFPFY